MVYHTVVINGLYW